LEEEAAAAGALDADKDIRPTHVGATKGGDASGDEPGDDDDDEPERRWNLRKCSAMGLDHISNVYNDEILPLLMPVVEARLGDGDWKKRESAILALGAVRCVCVWLLVFGGGEGMGLGWGYGEYAVFLLLQLVAVCLKAAAIRNSPPTHTHTHTQPLQ